MSDSMWILTCASSEPVRRFFFVFSRILIILLELGSTCPHVVFHWSNDQSIKSYISLSTETNNKCRPKDFCAPPLKNPWRRHYVLRLSVRPWTVISHDAISVYLLDWLECIQRVRGYCWKRFQGQRSKVKIATRLNTTMAEEYIRCVSLFSLIRETLVRS